jgi:hypothetical protein
VRARIWQLAHYGYFGPPLDMQLQPGMSAGKEKTDIVEKFWRKLEEQTEQVLVTHSAEVHAVAQALLDRNDLTGKQCIEVIRNAAINQDAPDSELLLRSLVEETIVNGSKPEEVPAENEKAKPKTKSKAKAKAKVE